MSSILASAVGPGDLLDHYRIEGLVASGGMASIFRATDTRTGHLVALKVPHVETARDRAVTESLQAEIELARRFDHPGLAKILAGDGGSGRYAVMEWIEGRTLRKIIDQQGSLRPQRAIRIALSICGALDHMHSRGTVHHDLKPENVIIDGEDNVKLVDFGIASCTDPSLMKLSPPRSAMGTPDYVSPEQIKGKRGDARSDVYSLGVMLYEMLTGEVPFSGLDPLTAMNLRSIVDPPCPREINPAISVRLRDIIHRAIARDGGKRFASARTFASAMSELLAAEELSCSLGSLACR